MARSKVLGRARLKARLSKIPGRVIVACEAQFDLEIDALVQAVKRAVPVKTGTMRDTVRAEPGDKPNSRRIVVGGVPATRKKVRSGVSFDDFQKAKASGGSKGEYDYPMGVEFGHRTVDGAHVPADPFLFPTYRARKRGMKRRLRAHARKAVKAAFEG